MKSILFSFFFFISIYGFSQDSNDSAYIKTLPLQARLVAYLAPYASANSDNDSLFTVFIKWRISERNNFVNGNTPITIDSIPTVELANMYNYCLSNSDGMGMAALMKSQIASARVAHIYLDNLCSQYENIWTQRLRLLIQSGFKLLRGF